MSSKVTTPRALARLKEGQQLRIQVKVEIRLSYPDRGRISVPPGIYEAFVEPITPNGSNASYLWIVLPFNGTTPGMACPAWQMLLNRDAIVIERV